MAGDDTPPETGGQAKPEVAPPNRWLRRSFLTAAVIVVVLAIVVVVAKVIIPPEFGNLTAYSAEEIMRAKSACEQYADDDQWWQCWLQQMRTLDRN